MPITFAPPAGDPAALAAFYERWGRRALMMLVVVLSFPTLLLPLGIKYDQQWVAAINELSARGVRIGVDVAFSYGPLGPALNPMDRGENLAWTIPMALTLSALWWWPTWLLLKRQEHLSDAAVMALGFAMSQLITDYAGTVPLCGVLAWASLSLIERRPARGLWAGPLAGVALLAKPSVGVACALTVAVWAVLTLIRHRNLRVIPMVLGSLLGGGLTLVGCWLALRLPLDALGGYFADVGRISAGYAAQLTRAGEPWMEALPIPVALGTLAVWVWAWRRRDPATAVAVLIVPALLYYYKWYITRVDGYRLLLVVPSLAGVFACALAAARADGPRVALRVAVLLLAGLGGVMIGAVLGIKPLENRLQSATDLLHLRGAQERTTREQRERLEREGRFSQVYLYWIGGGTVDTHGSADYVPFLLDPIKWRPGPVLQNILTCDPALDARAAARYARPDAPDLIVYHHQPIDGFLPQLMDCSHFLSLMQHYVPKNNGLPGTIDPATDRTILVRRSVPQWGALRPIGRGTTRLGEAVSVPAPPASGDPVMVAVRLQPSSWGRLRQVAYKVLPPRLVIGYRDGGTVERPFFWKNAVGGFLASDIPDDLPGVNALLAGREGRPVATLAVVADGGTFEERVEWAWFAP